MFGARNSYLLKLVSFSRRAVVPQPNPNFSSFVLLTTLLPEEKAAIDNLIRTLLPSVIPYLHDIINKHTQTVQRKSLGTKMKKLFHREMSYGSTQLEWIIRRLADCRMLIGDYENAFKDYELITEPKIERYFPVFATTREMMAVSRFLSGGKDAENYFEQATRFYQRGGEIRYAIRAALLHAGMLAAQDNYKVATDVYLTASDIASPATNFESADNDDFVAAMLMEQAAFCYLRLSPPLVRKFSFRLTIAGARFGQAMQPQHAARCYRVTHAMYHERGWCTIEDHTNLALAKFTFALGSVDDAASAVQRLVQRNSLPFFVQNSVLRELLHVFKTKNNHGSPPELFVPCIRKRCICVSLVDDPPPCRTTTCSSVVDYSYFTVSGRRGVKCRQQVGVVGEEVSIECDVYNHLAVPLQLEQVQLLATLAGAQRQASAQSKFTVKPFDLLLPPFEQKKLLLPVTVAAEGCLEIRGMLFRLCGCVWGKALFSPKHVCFSCARALARSPSPSLLLSPTLAAEDQPPLWLPIVGPRACVLAAVVGLPPSSQSLIEGEACACSFVLRNTSPLVPARDVCAAVSHPRYFAVALAAVDEAEQPQQLTSTAAAEWRCLIPVLGPNEEVSFPFWFRVPGDPTPRARQHVCMPPFILFAA
eukprot:TRINITY_DN624_c0_g1_i1.p1 TRINITY_DN624_c0_g1~~TRINITY_DN624_c0_g1_i1.p1  ORF type:complete len:647 (+),score=169.21 TRINITY_DN624_c0_g1_i1:781-2721(+)